MEQSSVLQRKQLFTAHISPNRNSIDSICNLYTADSPSTAVGNSSNTNSSYVDEELDLGSSTPTNTSTGTSDKEEVLPGYLSYLAIDDSKTKIQQQPVLAPTLKVKNKLRIQTDFPTKPKVDLGNNGSKVGVSMFSSDNTVGLRGEPKPAINSGSNERIRNRPNFSRQTNSSSNSSGSRSNLNVASRSATAVNEGNNWTTGRHERMNRPAVTRFPKRPSEPHLQRLNTNLPMKPSNVDLKSKAQLSIQRDDSSRSRSPTPSTGIPIQTRFVEKPELIPENQNSELRNLPSIRKPLFTNNHDYTETPVFKPAIVPRESITPRLVQDLIQPRKKSLPKIVNALQEVPERRESLFTKSSAAQAPKPVFGSQQRPHQLSTKAKMVPIMSPIPSSEDEHSDTETDVSSNYDSHRDSRISRYTQNSSSRSSTSSISIKKVKKRGFFGRLFGKK